MKGFFIFILMISAMLSVHSQSIYDFKVTALDGSTINFANFKGHKILIVNTASKCGYTPQYAKLQALFEMYQDKGLVIIGFPANNFLSQEPGTNEEIASFCQKNYGVTFPMAAKISVRGKKEHTLYTYLRKKAKQNKFNYPVTWNFGKYLIDENGQLIATFSPNVSPDDPEVISKLNM